MLLRHVLTKAVGCGDLGWRIDEEETAEAVLTALTGSGGNAAGGHGHGYGEP